MSTSEKKPKTIGIIGGMGPLAGVELHKRIIEKTDAQKDQEHLSVVHLSKSSLIGDRTEFLDGKSEENPGLIIKSLIDEAKSLGAQIYAVPCNTAHSHGIIESYQDEALVSILEATAQHLKKQNINEISFIGTHGSLKTSLYQNYLKSFNIQVHSLALEENDKFFHHAIYSIKSNGVTQSAIDEIIAGCKKLPNENILLGCTELSLIKDQLAKEFKVIDPLDALAHELVYRAKGNI